MSAFLDKSRKLLHIGTREQRKQHRIDRNALHARIKEEFRNQTRDIDGMGRIDPDRRRH